MQLVMARLAARKRCSNLKTLRERNHPRKHRSKRGQINLKKMGMGLKQREVGQKEMGLKINWELIH